MISINEKFFVMQGLIPLVADKTVEEGGTSRVFSCVEGRKNFTVLERENEENETKECHARPLVAWNCRRKS